MSAPPSSPKPPAFADAREHPDDRELVEVWDGSKWVPMERTFLHLLRTRIQPGGTFVPKNEPPPTPTLGQSYINASTNPPTFVTWNGKDWIPCATGKRFLLLVTIEQAARGLLMTMAPGRLIGARPTPQEAAAALLGCLQAFDELDELDAAAAAFQGPAPVRGEG